MGTKKRLRAMMVVSHYDSMIIWYGCVWKCRVPLNPMVLLIIIPIKWLFHWGYTLFSDKPICVQAKPQLGLSKCLSIPGPSWPLRVVREVRHIARGIFEWCARLLWVEVPATTNYLIIAQYHAISQDSKFFSTKSNSSYNGGPPSYKLVYNPI